MFEVIVKWYYKEMPYAAQPGSKAELLASLPIYNLNTAAATYTNTAPEKKVIWIRNLLSWSSDVTIDQ